MNQHPNQSTYAAEQARAHRAQQTHIRNTPLQPLPTFDRESAEHLLVAYSKPDTTQHLDPARQELAGLIELRNAASTTVEAKKAALGKAQQLCTTLRLDLDAARKASAFSADAQAAALVRCFESGDEPPAAQPVVTGNADQHAQQLEVAVAARDRLQSELTAAQAEYAKRQGQVVTAAFAILRADGDRIADEIQVLQQLVDERRFHIAALNSAAGGWPVKIGETTALQRPMLLSARSLATLERPAEHQYPVGQSPLTNVLPHWKGYHGRLCEDASATFEQI